jgi:hypothetical protein
MGRPSHIALLLSVAVLALPAGAQNKPAKQGTVQHVVVRDKGENVEVEIQTSGALASPETQAITGPDRIVVDFPGMIPSSELRAIQAHLGALKAVRSGLFFNDPPITRIVLDLAEPQSYHISTSGNAVLVTLAPASRADTEVAAARHSREPRLRDATLASGMKITAPQLSTVSAPVGAISRAEVPRAENSGGNSQGPGLKSPSEPPSPPKQGVTVTYENGLLSIHAERVTLAQVLFEVHMRTNAEIAIPAGAEQEQIIADYGPAPARDVLGALLNGSPYNFIFVGNELSLERVILTRRDSSNY